MSIKPLLRRILSIVLIFSGIVSAQDTFVIEGDTLEVDDDRWYEIMLEGGEGEGIFWMDDIFEKEVPVFYRFYPDGKLEYMQFGYARGKTFTFHGPGRFFWPNEEFQGKIFFDQGRLEGVLTEYYENGQLALLANYEKDSLHGIYKTFYEGGEPWEDMKYEHGVLEGKQRTWFPNGQLESEAGFADGKLEGVFRSFYENGKLESELNYENGYPEGTETIWYPNGNLWTEREYKEGGLLNVIRLLSPDGKPLDIGTFSNGYGVLYEYDIEGNWMGQTIYRRGNEVRRVEFEKGAVQED